MDEAWIIVLSIAMFLGSYLAGCFPLLFTLNERRIRLAGVFGAGLLVGTALCVIIPEGVHTITDHSQTKHPLLEKSAPIKREVQEARKKHSVQSLDQVEKQKAPKLVKRELEPLKLPQKASAKDEIDKAKEVPAKHHDALNTINSQETDKSHSEFQTSIIGVSLLIGFMFMFVIDQLAKRASSLRAMKGNISTLGLVIHAAADGLAMGSASSSEGSGQFQMQMLIFFAIMLHKAPAAFALASVLTMEGMERPRVRKHLLVFSLSAPIATLLTYFIITNVHIGSTTFYTGIILLFSAGTFLYISTVHVLPDLIDGKCGTHSTSSSGTSGAYSLVPTSSSTAGSPRRVSHPPHFSLFEIFLFCFSAIIPAILSFHGGH